MFKNSALTDLALWLVERSREPANLPLLFEGFCAQLTAAGLDLCRVLLGLETLHPELSGTMLLWQGGALEKVTTQRAGILTSDIRTCAARPGWSTRPASPSAGGPARAPATCHGWRAMPPRG